MLEIVRDGVSNLYISWQTKFVKTRQGPDRFGLCAGCCGTLAQKVNRHVISKKWRAVPSRANPPQYSWLGLDSVQSTQCSGRYSYPETFVPSPQYVWPLLSVKGTKDLAAPHQGQFWKELKSQTHFTQWRVRNDFSICRASFWESLRFYTHTRVCSTRSLGAPPRPNFWVTALRHSGSVYVWSSILDPHACMYGAAQILWQTNKMNKPILAVGFGQYFSVTWPAKGKVCGKDVT